MKIAVVGSRNLSPTEAQLAEVLSEATEIVSGGAKGVDSRAADYAKRHGLQLTEFLPQYALYGRAAPIVRNKAIVDYADKIIVFWDGSSRGARSVIDYAEKVMKPCVVILPGSPSASC